MIDHTLSMLSLIANAIFVGALGVWLRYRIQNRKLTIEESEDEGEREERRAVREQSALERALEVVTTQRDEAIAAIHDCHSRIEKTEMEVQGLRLSRDLDPFPSWIVGLDGRYLYVNREFEKVFLEPDGKGYRDLVGATHEAIWPPAFCRTLRNLDDLARRVPDGRGRATTDLVVGNESRQVTVQKFPIRIRGAVVAFAGYITDIQMRDEVML